MIMNSMDPFAAQLAINSTRLMKAASFRGTASW